ncbi:MAG: 30S ribosomal protein S10 [Patescibacteria group bacterium]|nr:30S ribosomal protein S10 [Patescibacteria group bacterium]
MPKGRIRVRLKSYDGRVIDRAAQMIIESAVRTGAKVSGPIPLPTRTQGLAMIKSSFVDKRSGEHFEIKHHGRLIDILEPTPKTIEGLSHLNLPAGVDIEIKM